LPKALWLGNYAISIAHGFTDLAWERNTIDARGGRSSLMVLAGNHWNVCLAENHLLGGGEAMRLSAGATECPGRWGWSRTPVFDLTVERNLCEDSRQGVGISDSDEAHSKTTAGRTYLTGVLKNNTIRWSEAFLHSFRATSQLPSAEPLSIHGGSLSEANARQVQLRLEGNRLETPLGVSTVSTVRGQNATADDRPKR
jgi:hypothetical protein